MKKISFLLASMAALAQSAEFQYGQGTFGMQGGFLGLSGEIDCDVTTYTMSDRHSNVGNFFYGYDLNWYDSKRMVQAQKTYNTMATSGNNLINTMVPVEDTAIIPEIAYRIKGLDANLYMGYDALRESENDFVGVGVLVGLSMPWIDSKKNDSAIPDLGFMLDQSGNLLNAQDMFADNKTEIMTYKIGPTLTVQKPLINHQLSLYGTASYAYQTGYIKNDYAHADFNVDGTFQSYNIGLHFSPFDQTFKWGWLTLSPRVYATLGYRYTQWDLDKVNIDISGNQMNSDILDPLAMKFGMDSSVGYFGIGYSF